MATGGMQTEPGGFLPQTLPSPPPSAPSTATSVLPQPRASPLRPGSAKEGAFQNYVDSKLLEVSGRYERRFQTDQTVNSANSTHSETIGYRGFAGMARDLDAIIDIIWISGTPNLQIPFLFNVALAITEYVKSFDFAAQSTLELLDKLDCAFSSLLHGQDIATGHPLPGLESGRRMTMTEKIRLQAIVERTRVLLIDISRTEAAGNEPGLESQDTTTADEDESGDHARYVGDGEDVELEIANVYARTLEGLSNSLAPDFS